VIVLHGNDLYDEVRLIYSKEMNNIRLNMTKEENQSG